MDIALRALFLYAFVVFVMRVLGRRELSSLSAVDLVLLIVLGDAIQQGLTQDDYSVTGAVIAVSTIGALQVASSYLAFRSKRVRKVIEGEPIVVIQDGKPIEKTLKRERLTEDEIAEEMRMQQIASFDDVQWESWKRTARSASSRSNRDPCPGRLARRARARGASSSDRLEMAPRAYAASRGCAAAKAESVSRRASVFGSPSEARSRSCRALCGLVRSVSAW
jgi:hypothetical protein